jgi:hypothetical protein
MFDLLSKSAVQEQSTPVRNGSKVSDVLREGRVTIGMNMAKDILSQCYYEPQRRRDNTNGTHVEIYAEQMKRGLWKPGSQIAFARVGSSLLLVNGYHRMWAVSESGKPQVFQVLIQEFKSMDEVGQWYYSFDHLMRKRSDRQILEAAGLYDDYSDVRRELASSAYNAAWILGTGFSIWGNVHKPKVWKLPDHVAANLELWKGALRSYNAAMTQADTKVGTFFYSTGCVAVALATLRYRQKEATEFWVGAIQDDGLRKTDPRRALNMWTQRPRSVGTSFDAACAATTAWNAFFNGDSLQLIRTGERRPLAIAGTPFKGGKK